MDNEKNVIRTFAKSGRDVRLASETQIEVPFQTLGLPVVSRQKFNAVVWPTAGWVADMSVPEKKWILVSMPVGEYLAAHPNECHHWVFGPDSGPDSVVRDQRGQICGTKRFVYYACPFGTEFACPICASWQPDFGYCRGCGQYLNEDCMHIEGTHLFFREGKFIRTPVSVSDANDVHPGAKEVVTDALSTQPEAKKPRVEK